MDNGAQNKISPSDKKTFEWISEHYTGSLHGLIDSNRSYLNQGITWSIGILSAVILFIFTYLGPLQELKDTSSKSLARSFAFLHQNITEMDILVLSAALSISFAFVSNFLSRSIKGYVNLVRYSALHARCLDLITSDLKESPEDVQNLIRDIRQFDASFASPLKLSVALWKMFTELGYGLFFGILIVLQTFATVAWWEMNMSIPCLWFVLVLAFGPLWLAAEIVFLRYFSSYFRGASANWAEALRLR